MKWKYENVGKCRIILIEACRFLLELVSIMVVPIQVVLDLRIDQTHH